MHKDATPAAPWWRPRRGLPAVREKLRSGAPLRIVAYGSSITAQGYYLNHVRDELRAAYPAADVSLTIVGRNGWDTLFAAFGCADAIRERPDLLLVEFSVNDHAPAIDPYIIPALDGIVHQTRSAQPACDIGLVYNLRMIGDERIAQRSIERYEALADREGIPSLDLDAAFADFVARGIARYRGDVTSADALTVDGTHHAPAAAHLAGIPFARALLETIGGDAPAEWANSSATELVPPFDGRDFCEIVMQRNLHRDPRLYEGAVIRIAGTSREHRAESPFRRARCLAPRDLIASEHWALGEVRKVIPNMYHRDELLIAAAPGARLRFTCGTFACLMGFTHGFDMALTLRIDGEPYVARPVFMYDTEQGQQSVWILAVTDGLSDAPHVVEVIAERAMVAFTDVFVIAPPEPARY